ncbi:MAG: hypothetical protein ACTSUE_09840 [Promethearchaeota archaeon]
MMEKIKYGNMRPIFDFYNPHEKVPVKEDQKYIHITDERSKEPERVKRKIMILFTETSAQEKDYVNRMEMDLKEITDSIFKGKDSVSKDIFYAAIKHLYGADKWKTRKLPCFKKGELFQKREDFETMFRDFWPIRSEGFTFYFRTTRENPMARGTTISEIGHLTENCTWWLGGNILSNDFNDTCRAHPSKVYGRFSSKVDDGMQQRSLVIGYYSEWFSEMKLWKYVRLNGVYDVVQKKEGMTATMYHRTIQSVTNTFVNKLEPHLNLGRLI